MHAMPFLKVSEISIETVEKKVLMNIIPGNQPYFCQYFQNNN